MSFSAPEARPLILLVAREGPATNPSCKPKAAGISGKFRRAQALCGGGAGGGVLGQPGSGAGLLLGSQGPRLGIELVGGEGGHCQLQARRREEA